MAGRSGVTITGGPETARAFDKLDEDVLNMGATHHKVAQARLAGVRGRTPVLSGTLGSSWDATGDASGGSIVSEVRYAAVIEYGSAMRNIVGARMIRDTLAAEEGELVREYEAAIAEAAKRRGFRVD